MEAVEAIIDQIIDNGIYNQNINRESFMELLGGLATLLDDTEKMKYSSNTLRYIGRWKDKLKEDIEKIKKLDPNRALSRMRGIDYTSLRQIMGLSVNPRAILLQVNVIMNQMFRKIDYGRTCHK